MYNQNFQSIIQGYEKITSFLNVKSPKKFIKIHTAINQAKLAGQKIMHTCPWCLHETSSNGRKCTTCQEILDELYSLIVKLEQSSITDISANLSLNNMALSAEYYYNLLIEKNNLKTLNNIVANVLSLLRYVANEEVLMDSFLPYESEIRRILVRIVIIINELL